jgi:ribosomal protein S18 acetylase RimI-like enzyme
MKFIPIDINKHKNYILPFRRDSFIISFGTDKDFGSEEEYLNWIKIRSMKYPNGFVIVVEDETVIGQLELTIREYNENQIGYINLYYLIPEKRGIGLGKKLHEYALNFFKENSLSEYHLRVSPTNYQALSFYRKNGMQELQTKLDGKVLRMKGLI